MRKDLIYHFVVCLIIAIYSTEAAIAAGVTKEYADSKSQGNRWDWADIAADMAGVAVGTAIRILLIRRWNWI